MNDDLSQQLETRLARLNAEAEAQQEARLTNDLRTWVNRELGPEYAERVIGPSVTFGTITLEACKPQSITSEIYYIPKPCPHCGQGRMGYRLEHIRNLAWAVKAATQHKCPPKEETPGPTPAQWVLDALVDLLETAGCRFERD